MQISTELDEFNVFSNTFKKGNLDCCAYTGVTLMNVHLVCCNHNLPCRSARLYHCGFESVCLTPPSKNTIFYIMDADTDTEPQYEV